MSSLQDIGGRCLDNMSNYLGRADILALHSACQDTYADTEHLVEYHRKQTDAMIQYFQTLQADDQIFVASEVLGDAILSFGLCVKVELSTGSKTPYYVFFDFMHMSGKAVTVDP